ncbi:hypothetical protein FJ950_29205 [Mesorhizobium sp. B2-3-14]|uniref:hypothetical protein n=1 Tax=Mesorhizobium sp. B2-3-14 TaxID=2589950 RepID=UPI0011280259|nr:hypothetical protein [Mesorhizobium sp. B2-3-14]TPL79017.1 hypothetical protein FJ950_29205 [Mesorhizobium sp. B2-3-14]
MQNCQSTSKASQIKVEEKGKRAIFLNPKKEKLVRTMFDGCVVNNAIAADWIVSKNGIGDVIVELKGCKIEHAADQICATAKYLTDHGHRQGKVSGLIVCSRYPSEDSTFQRIQLRFAKTFNGPIRAVNKVAVMTFDNALAFP